MKKMEDGRVKMEERGAASSSFFHLHSSIFPLRSPVLRLRFRGLTLAEVLATITIMAIVLPVLMQGISIASGLASVTKQRAQALALAQNKLDELILTGDWQTASMNGDFSPDYPEYTWDANVGDWEELNMQQLQVVVHWSSRGVARDVTLNTLVYNNPEVATQ